MVWTQEELEFLQEHYPDNYTEDIALALERPMRAVYDKARKLGLKKTKEFIRSVGKAGCNHPKAVASRFQKGQAPANKGKGMTAELREKVKHTWFQKGNKPANTKTDGALSKRADGYWWIRVGLAKWVPMHVHVWEQHNGPVKPGDVIKFRDGNTDNYEIDNLVLSDRKSNMLDNSIHNYPVELKQAIRSFHKLNKVITKYEK